MNNEEGRKKKGKRRGARTGVEEIKQERREDGIGEKEKMKYEEKEGRQG